MSLGQIGGSFAPPITPEKLAAYRAAAASAPAPIKEAIGKLADMVQKFQQTPASTLPGAAHPSGAGVIVPLTPAEMARIDDVVPWPHECDMYGALFDGIPPEQKELRNAAFHLLWFARELTLDREPLTNERL